MRAARPLKARRRGDERFDDIQPAKHRGRKLINACALCDRRIGLSTIGGMSGVPVEFRREGQLLGTARTDANGMATITCDAGDGGWAFSAHAITPRGERVSESTVYAWPAERPALLFDLDDTLLKSEKTGMVWRLEDTSPPMPHARETLTALAKDYQIIYLSARARIFRDMTRTWMKQHDFPPAPMMFADSFAYYFRQKEARVGLIRQLQAAGVTIAAGIGDKEADEQALHETGLPCIIVTPGYRAEFSETIVIEGLKDLPAVVKRIRVERKLPEVPGE